MKKVIRLTESDLIKLVKTVLTEQINPNWDKAKNYLLTTGFDGVKGKVTSINVVTVQGKKFTYDFFEDGNVNLKYTRSGEDWNSAKNYWSWDGQKVILKNPLPSISKNVSGFAQTVEDIKSGNKILGVGSRGDLVKKIQYAVNYWTGINSGCKTDKSGKVPDWTYCDGVYGQNTKNAVKKFQRNNGLSVDGNVGTQTLSFIDDEFLK